MPVRCPAALSTFQARPCVTAMFRQSYQAAMNSFHFWTM
jgi:hypothetical protein